MSMLFVWLTSRGQQSAENRHVPVDVLNILLFTLTWWPVQCFVKSFASVGTLFYGVPSVFWRTVSGMFDIPQDAQTYFCQSVGRNLTIDRYRCGLLLSDMSAEG